MVSGLDHQADDALHDAERDQGPPHHFRHVVHRIAQRHRAGADQDGLPGRHAGDRRQCAQDDDGEVGQRHGGAARRRHRRLDRRFRRAR